MLQHVLEGLLEALSPPADGQASRPWASLQQLAADELPAPYGQLLAHERDMTRTLEGFLGASLVLEPIGQRQEEDRLLRKVVLLERGRERRVAEAGVIRIELATLEEPARSHVLRGEQPLGGILHTHGIAHRGCPEGYFRCTPGPELRDLLQSPGTENLYGRVSRLHRVDDGRLIAKAVEILPSLAEKGGSRY